MAKMSALEQEPPTSKQAIKKIEDTGKLPVWLLKDDATNKTQVYIKGINDGELAIWRNDNCKLEWVAAKELAEHAVKFAVLDAPILDYAQKHERAVWSDEAKGFKGTQRNPAYAGVKTSNGPLDFDKSGYNTWPAKERLRKGAEELRQKKAELRKELTRTLAGISSTKDDVEEIEDTVEDIIEPEQEDELELQMQVIYNLLRRAEFRAKNILFALEDIPEEELSLVLGDHMDMFEIVTRFALVKQKIQVFQQAVEEFRNNHPTVKVYLDALINEGEFIDADTGEYYNGSGWSVNELKAFINQYNQELDKVDIEELDWE